MGAADSAGAFEVPASEEWPKRPHGMRLGSAVKNMRCKQAHVIRSGGSG
jgi:hypothetical protein